jgi:hypothetical protein
MEFEELAAKLLTVKSAAQRLGISAKAVYLAIADGRLEVVEIDGVKFIPIGQLAWFVPGERHVRAGRIRAQKAGQATRPSKAKTGKRS